MREASRWAAVCLVAGAVLALGACGGKPVIKSDLGMEDAPEWVNKGTAYLDDDQGRVFHGVGSAPTMGDQSLQISTADDRARAALARVLTTYMDVVSRDYRSASGSGQDAAADQSVTRQIKALTKVNLTGAKIAGRWKDKHTGTIYAIAELDMRHVKQTVGNVSDMDAGLRQYIQEHGDNIFDRVKQGNQ